MKLRRYSIFILIISLAWACAGINKSGKQTPEVDESINNAKYYRFFVDGTKNALFGNYKYAIPYYEECIKLYPDRGAPYYQLSSIYLSLKDVERAIWNSRKALELDSSNSWYKTHLANIYQYTGKIDSAIVLYESLVEEKNSKELEYNLALLYSQNNMDDKAVELINSMDSEMQGSREILMLKHNAFHNMRMIDSALFVLETVSKYFPDDITSYGMMAEYLNEIGRRENAKKIYFDVIEKDSTNGLFLLSLAEFYMQSNNIDSAFVFYGKAFCCSDLPTNDKISVVLNLLSDPEFIASHVKKVIELIYTINIDERGFSFYASIADVYINLEDYVNAKPYLDSALTYEKNNYLLWEQTLLVNNFLAYDNEVIRIASDALEYYPDKPNLYLVRAYSYNANEDFLKCLQDIDSVMTFELNERLYLQALNLKAEVYRTIGNHQESDAAFELILKDYPDNLLVRNNYAYYLSLREENLQRAKELSLLTVKTEPANSTYLDTYGWVLFKLGDLQEAKKYIELAIRNGAYNNPEVLEHYGDIMKSLFKCDEAVEAYRQVLDVDSSNTLVQKKILLLEEECK